jgi:hypothetical protein
MTTNKIYATPGTAVTFTKSGGDVTFTLDDTVDLGNGQVSNQWDRGAGPSYPILYKWEFYCKWVATPTLSDSARLYLYDAQSANTAVDLSADGDVTPESKFNNFRLIGSCICSVAADQTFYACGLVAIYGRYVNLGVWNGSGTKDLNATANVSKVILTPMPDDIQAAS